MQAEHSMELHMPYLMHVMAGHPFTLVPIMVGALPFERCAIGERHLVVPIFPMAPASYQQSTHLLHRGPSLAGDAQRCLPCPAGISWDMYVTAKV